ncbi:hypothetical protein IE53DRAFT_237577 [Violaceomyces palustris]|uniref:Uncharacterized protein n=1 Tax=Violaceomyces palustris TaxID=1673888 RepID=A0ACD0NPF5_9BASI|nr:hypothetical protein IE53DRAFT_237577 [Violaceomyces palustris]
MRPETRISTLSSHSMQVGKGRMERIGRMGGKLATSVTPPQRKSSMPFPTGDHQTRRKKAPWFREVLPSPSSLTQPPTRTCSRRFIGIFFSFFLLPSLLPPLLSSTYQLRPRSFFSSKGFHLEKEEGVGW